MLIARSMLDTGLARRIALLFIRAFGKTSLGVSYALLMTDVTLASGVPSITARSAGMLLPVARRIAELFDSRPGRLPSGSAPSSSPACIKVRRSPARCSSPARPATSSAHPSLRSS